MTTSTMTKRMEVETTPQQRQLSKITTECTTRRVELSSRQPRK